MRNITLALYLSLGLVGCSSSSASTSQASNDPRPAGPAAIAAPTITAISTAPGDVEHGHQLFTAKGCVACHKIGGGKLVGPDLKGVTARRNPQWIARMILHPELMIQQDETAHGLLAKYLTPMANQNVNPDTELPALLSYLKSNEN